MSKWYKSALVKGILIFLSVLSAITALLSLVIISTYSVSVKEIWNKKPTEYTDSKEFENQMCRATMDVLGQISYEDIFETDGKYNPDSMDITEGTMMKRRKDCGINSRIFRNGVRSIKITMQRRKIPSLSVKKQIKPIITITGMNF